MFSAFTPLATFERTCRDVGLVPIPDSRTAANIISIRSPVVQPGGLVVDDDASLSSSALTQLGCWYRASKE
jgi:hypothetical protein